MPPVVAFVVAMPMELTPLTRALSLRRSTDGPTEAWTGRLGARQVVAVVTGMGTALATAGVDRLLESTPVERVVVVGIAGAVDGETPIGTVVRPALVVDGASGEEYRPDPLGPEVPAGTLWTSDSLITDPDVLEELRREGVVALDMETAAVAAVCRRRNVPWSVLRAISDRATDGSLDDEVFGLSHQDGTPDGKAVASYVLRHPGRIPTMARLANGARLAARRAAEAAVSAVAALDDGAG
jgi:adenosylhomocysteine nucleosidase